MYLNFKTAKSYNKPKEIIDTSSSFFVNYIYKDVIEHKTIDIVTSSEITYYTFEVATISKKDYEKYYLEIQKDIELNELKEEIKKVKKSSSFDGEISNPEELTTADKLKLLVDSIDVNIPTEIDKKTGKEKHFPKKLGYKWKPIYDGTRFTYELVEDPYAQGTETNPIEFVPGMEVYLMWFYTEGKHTYVCIKEGNPQKITDKEYFEKM